MQTTSHDAIRTTVRNLYDAVARGNEATCCGTTGCGPATIDAHRQLGYSDAEMASVPDGANLGLGCGNPQAIAALAPGERVLDLGSGAGFDALLAARQVGQAGSVIGVDMTPAMVDRARANASKAGLSHVDFRLGQIEQLPVASASIDVVMSNCVINLSPDKPAVFREAFRVLVPGGRLAISDIVAIDRIPDDVAASPAAYTGCIAGAAPIAHLERMLTGAGFERVRVTVNPSSRALVDSWDAETRAGRYVASAAIEAIKPAASGCCDSTRQATCCEPAAKAACCGTSASDAGCGCQPAGPPTR